jgi:outer membrane protein assembly factor BamB
VCNIVCIGNRKEWAMSRRLGLTLALAGITCVVIASAANAQVPYVQSLVPKRTALARVGLERQWTTVVPLTGVERLMNISLAENLMFAQTTAANFYVYEAETGRLLWSARLGTQTGTARPASVNSKRVFATNATQLHALDRLTGRTVWVTDLGNLPSSETAADEHHVMVGMTNGKLMAFHTETGVFAWNWQTGGPVRSRPLPATTMVAFGGGDNKLYVAMADEVVMLYRIATGGEIGEGLGNYGNRLLIVPSADHNVYGVDMFTAKVKWIFSSGAPVHQEPLVVDKDGYVINSKGFLSALDVETGEPRWTTSTHGGRLLSISAKRLYLESADDDLFVIDRQTGQVLADPASTFYRSGLNLRHFDLGPTNRANDRIFLATTSGLVVCIREIGQTAPRPIRDPKMPPFGSIPPEGVDLEEKLPQPDATPAPGENATPAPADNATPAPAPGDDKAMPPKEQEK